RLDKKEVEMRMGNGALVCAKAVGTARLTLPSGHLLELDDCFYVPDIVKNIISISRLSDIGYSLTTTANGCSILFNGLSVAYGHLVNGLYVLDTLSDVLQVTRTNSNEINPSYLWHCRLGHIGEKRISHLHSSGYLNSFEYKPFDTCERCIMGKMTKAPFSGQGERASELLELVHTDVCGPMSKEAKGGYSYFITFTDDYSRFGFVYLMRHKSEAFEKFEEYRNEVEKQNGKSIKALRSDRGGEYLSQEFVAYLKHHGIVSQWTPPYTPQHNGVSERRNRTLLDMVRSMMSRSELPIYLWGYALETAAYLVNRVPSKSVSSTPYEIWKGRKPNFSHMKVWGCPAHVKKHQADKLDSRTDRCRFIGYPKETFGYQFYHPIERKVLVARKAIFLEREYILQENSGSVIDLEEVQETVTDSISMDEMTLADPIGPTSQDVRRSGRVSKEPERYVGHVSEGPSEGRTIDGDDPQSYQEAMNSSDSN